jgi:hypothetical protein
MYARIPRIGAAMAAALLMLFPGTYAIAAEPAAAKQPSQVDVRELRISTDGKSIVDQNGREVARFAQDIQVNRAGSVSQNLKGCLCCTEDCIVYDRNGVCIKKYNSCTWDFECSCRK